jgi:integrase
MNAPQTRPLSAPVAQPEKAHRRQRGKRNLKKLTEENVLKLPVKRRPYYAWDSGTDAARGLGVLVLPTGTRSFRCVYYYPGSGKPHSMHLGRVGEMSLADARKRTQAARAKSREGFDPKAADVRQSDDFKSAVEDYVQRWQKGKRNNATADEVERILLKACAAWHHRPVATIRLQEIDNLLNTIRAGDKATGLKAHGYLANKVHALLRTFFAWCAKAQIGKIKASPMIDLERPYDGMKRRERHFTDDEIIAIWRAANTIGGVEGKFLKALLLTGKRKGALSRMRFQHIDQAWFWEPPETESTKNKRLLPVPLSERMQSVIGKRQPKGYVFPGPVEHTHYIDDGTLRLKVRRASGVADFYVHALRHTVETKLAKLGVLPHIRDLLLDHQPQRGSGAIYDHHAYGTEMREAIEKWATYVDGLVQPKLVTQKQEQA